MRALPPILRSVQGGGFTFWCPGCEEPHHVGPSWSYNGNPDKPTFTPSILVRSGHYIPGHEDQCWCKYNADLVAKGEEPSGFTCSVCHSYVTDGRIQFLGDCTHALAGQTVELPEWAP